MDNERNHHIHNIIKGIYYALCKCIKSSVCYRATMF